MNPIKLVFAGDFCSIHPDKLKMGSALNKIIEGADIRFVNFEGPLQLGHLESANNFYLRQSKDSPNWLMEQGFNVIGLANNHARDFGEEGLMATKKAFTNALTIGCGDGWEAAYSVSYINVKGKTLGFLNATSADFASLQNEWEDSDQYGCPWINHPSIPRIIIKAKEQCDFLFVLPHAGVEFMDVPLPQWRTIYRNLIDYGADAVIAAHPHVPQGWECYKNRPIFYSLGNFVFERETEAAIPYWNNGVLACIELNDDIISVSYHCTLYKNNMVDIDGSTASKSHVELLSTYLQDREIYKNVVEKYIFALSMKYKCWMMSSAGAIQVLPFSWKTFPKVMRMVLQGEKNDKTFLHQIREESSRWMIERTTNI